jgi:hypothetical protein
VKKGMKKELMIILIVITLVVSAFVFAKPNKNMYDAKETGNRSFVNFVDHNMEPLEPEGWVQYSKRLPHLHTTWDVWGLEPNTEYQLKLHCKHIDSRLHVGEQYDPPGDPSGIWLWGDWGPETFLVMDIVLSDDDGHIGYGLDECRLVVGLYDDMQFIITKNSAPWASAWTWENIDKDGNEDISDFEITHADLILVKKDPDGPDDIMGTADDWSPVWDSFGVLIYDKASSTFNYEFYGVNLQISTGYSLIYYGDPWPGNHPGALIATGTSDSSGLLHISSGTVELNMHLPHASDANYPTGAKIWLVPSSDYNSGTNSMQAWNPANYLFEYELITYFDTDLT